MTEASDIARLRQGLYRFFGGALTLPSPDHLETVMSAAVMLDGMGVDDYAFYGRWLELMAVLDEGVDPEALEGEYIRLFASGTDQALCPPIESFYLARAEGGGMAEVVAELQRTYAQLGISVSSGEAVDHVSTELEVLGELCAREVAAWIAADLDEVARLLARQHLMLRTHLMAWAPQFRRRVIAADRTGFYAAAAEAAYAFLVHDVDWTRTLLKSLEVGS